MVNLMEIRRYQGVLLGLVVWLLAVEIQAEVIMPVLKSPKPYPDVDMPYISPAQMEKAFSRAQQNAQNRANLESDLPGKGGTIPQGSNSAKARHQKFTAIEPNTIKIDENQEIFEEASKDLVKTLSKDQAAYGLSTVDMPHGSNRAKQTIQKCQSMFGTGNCNFNSKFRTADGSCNNQNNPLWGKSFTCFARLVPPDYSDGLSAHRLAASGSELPNARVVSRFIHDDLDVQARDYTLMTMQWGQFMDHDMTLTPMTRAGSSMNMIECCNPNAPFHPACFPIEIPPDDDFYAPQGVDCLNFVRSAACNADCKLGAREQTNQLTAFIDASNIYGSELNDTNQLRLFRGGLMKSTNHRVGELLPPSRDPNNDQCSRPNREGICFQAGDERVNEQPGLTSMHTVWLRQHNRIASYFQTQYPGASDEDIFQETRRIVGAQLQAITYGEFLPVVLGPDYMDYFHLAPLPRGFTDYDPDTQPTIVHEFSTAAYRFGHTLIDNVFHEVDARGRNTKNLVLADNFFFPFTLFNGELDSILRGLFLSPAQQFDRHIVESVTNHLYKPREDPFGMDLPALNLQRGRDHGINGYTTYLDYCFDIKVRSFNDLRRFMPTDTVQQLQKLYLSVHDVELFTAGVAETPLPGGVVGPTFGCIIGLQFHHLKFGDRFYFEHQNQAGSFTPNQLNSIRQTTLSRVLCANTNINQVSVNAFSTQNSYTSCDSLPDLSLNYW